jgi:hypothetical protein
MRTIVLTHNVILIDCTFHDSVTNEIRHEWMAHICGSNPDPALLESSKGAFPELVIVLEFLEYISEWVGTICGVMLINAFIPDGVLVPTRVIPVGPHDFLERELLQIRHMLHIC